MKILLTGGSGYIGTALTPMLLEQGHEVTNFDSLLITGYATIPFFRHPNYSFIKGDIRDKESLKKVVEGQDIIIHLAAIVGFPACSKDPSLAYTTNVEGTQNLTDLIKPSQYVLFGSTGSNYGALVDGVCTEETPLNPLSLYGKTKTEAERMLMEKGNATAYRFATAFGISPRLRLDLLVNDLTHQAVKQKHMVVYEANFMRTFIHVHDIARSFMFAIDNRDKMIGEVFNVGDDRMNFSKREVCEMIVKKTNAYVHYADVGEDADKRNYIVSYDKINKLGFQTTISLDEGIEELIKAVQVVENKNPYANI